MRQRTLLLGLSLYILPGLASAQVVVSDGSGTSYRTVQAAVDASSDGDLLLLGPGPHEAFTIDGKGLSLVAAVPGVAIDGTVTVRNLPAGRAVAFAGLAFRGRTLGFLSETAMILETNSGSVRFFGCSIAGGAGMIDPFFDDFGTGGDGLVVTACADVALTGCSVRGGNGGGTICGFGCECFAGSGGDAVMAMLSAVVAYDSTFTGGGGGHCGIQGGSGGTGAEMTGGGLLAVGCEFTGGDGGNGNDLFGTGGDGGHGIAILTGAQLRLRDCDFFPGTEGLGDFGFGMNGTPGEEVTGVPNPMQMAGTARRFTFSNLLPDDGTTVDVTVEGESGDEAFLILGKRPGFSFLPYLMGTLLVPDVRAVLTLGTVPASGVLNAQIPVHELRAGDAHDQVFLQGLIAGAGSSGRFVEGAAYFAILDREGAPDCTGNQVMDVFDVVEGNEPDCDGNLVPDGCDPDCNANGMVDVCEILGGVADCNGNFVPDLCEMLPDCNSNGTLDECDIAMGRSSDLNSNGVPDECDPSGLTWHVDSNAAPSGDGSATSPFRLIGDALATSLTGDTILLADGTYTGPGNRDLAFEGRGVVVRSRNGPASCIIDCQLEARAFTLTGNDGTLARIEGLTFYRGAVVVDGGAIEATGTHLDVVNCVFNQCSAGSGGAISYEGTTFTGQEQLTVRDCEFVLNDATGTGGALDLRGGPARIESCLFRLNTAAAGGAVWMQGIDMVVSHSQFLANSVTGSGGAVVAGATATLDNLLLAGNSANLGGALFVLFQFGTGARVQNCTIVDNEATSSAASIFVGANGVLELTNSIVWGNVGPNEIENRNQLTVSFSNVEGGMAGVVLNFGGTLNWGAGNLDAVPLFADPIGNDPSSVFDNDYRLGAGSPCVDAGDNASIGDDTTDVDGDGDVLEEVPLDLDGAPRRVDDPAVADTGSGTPPVVDMGGYERQP